jgi:hypothetical protein
VPGRCFNTFPFIVDDPQERLDKIGCAFHKACSEQMISQQQGLTDFYNHFHDPNEKDESIIRLRGLHEKMDNVVAVAYGWNDLDLRHDFYKIKKDMRYTISKSSRNIVHDRLIALNRQRHEEEVKAGFHDNKLKSSNTRLKAVK